MLLLILVVIGLLIWIPISLKMAGEGIRDLKQQYKEAKKVRCMACGGDHLTSQHGL